MPYGALTSAEHCTASCPSRFCPKRHGMVRAPLQTPLTTTCISASLPAGAMRCPVSAQTGEPEGNGKHLPSIPCLANPTAFPSSGVFGYRLWAPAFSLPTDHLGCRKFLVIFSSAFEFKLHLEGTAKLLLLLVTQL